MLIEAGKALDTGQLTLADILARQALDTQPANARGHAILAAVAERLARPDLAWDHATRALEINPSTQDARKRLKSLGPARPAEPTRPEPGTNGYLVIKSWSAGFWSDVNHVLGQALLAEITGRTPVVEWGAGSLYRDEGVQNAWESFFEPLSPESAESLRGRGLDYYPPKWNDANLLDAEVGKWDGPGSRLGLELLPRTERIAVSDFNLRPFSLLPWIPTWHPLHGAHIEQVYRDISARYARPRPEIAAKADAFVREHFGTRAVLGVHIRATDKVVEDPRLHQINTQYTGLVDRHLERNPDARIFLLTDGSSVYDQFRERYGERLIATDSIRSDSQTGVHFQKHDTPSQIGLEVLLDVLIATKCDAFIGLGNSSVSTFVMHLKSWPEGSIQLLGGVVNHHTRNPYVYMTRRSPIGR